MANKLRFRSGQVELHRYRVDPTTQIEAGDLVYRDGHVVRPAHDFPWQGDLATTQAAFAAAFVGVAHTAKAVGQSQDVSVDQSPLAIYEFDVVSGAFDVGDGLAPAPAAGNHLQSQQLTAIASGGHAIARAGEYKSLPSLTLHVQFASAFHPASANASARLG